MKARILSLITSLMLLCTLSGCETAPGDTSMYQPSVQVHMIDVGQGASFFVDVGEYEILIDAGRDQYGETVSRYISGMVDDELDLVIATHPDADHIGGLDQVLKDYKTEKIIDSGDLSKLDSKEYREYKEAAEQSGTTIIDDADMTFPIAKDVTFEIIECADGEYKTNNNSVISELTAYGKKYVFMGDTEAKIERDYIDKFEDIDVLAVAHHGSSSSTTPEFLDKVTPEYALISDGQVYGHPTEKTRNALKERNVEVYRTDLQGSVVSTVKPDGHITFNVPALREEENVSPNQTADEASAPTPVETVPYKTASPAPEKTELPKLN